MDAIINASNTRLRLGSGVSGAIRRAAGPGLQNDMLNRRWPEGLLSSPALMDSVYRKILHVATASGHLTYRPACSAILDRACQLKLDHIAIPAIGAGVGTMPAATCAQLLLDALKTLLPEATAFKR